VDHRLTRGPDSGLLFGLFFFFLPAEMRTNVSGGRALVDKRGGWGGLKASRSREAASDLPHWQISSFRAHPFSRDFQFLSFFSSPFSDISLSIRLLCGGWLPCLETEAAEKGTMLNHLAAGGG